MFEEERSYHISIVSRMLKMHPQTIRHYENLGLIKPQRSTGNVRLFSEQIVKRLQQINSFTELGINLAGVEVIMNLLDKMEAMRRNLETEMMKSKLELEELRRKFDPKA